MNVMAVRVAAQLIACGGRTPFPKLRDLARYHRLPNRRVKAAVKTLQREELVRIDGEEVVADDLAELAAYVADEYERTEDGGQSDG